MTRRGLAGVVLLLACLHVRPAEACSCMAAAPCQALWMREGRPNVFEATVESIEHVAESGTMLRVLAGPWPSRAIVHLKDVRALLGDSTTTVETSADGASCGYRFEVGRRYVIDANEQDGQFSTGSCSQTRPIEQAGPLLDYVASLGRPSPGATITGTAQLSALSGFSPRARPRGVAGLVVAIDGPVSRTTATGEDGSFSFTALPPGQYRVTGTPGPVQAFLESPRSLDVRLPNAHACHNAFIGVELRASIEGTVIDAQGRPVSKASVALRLEDALTAPPVEGFGHFVGYARTRSDDFGRYEFRSVPPGRYVAGVNLDSGPTFGSPYRAAAIAGPGGIPEVIDFPLGGHVVLPPLVAVVPATVTITGRAAWPDGRPGAHLKVRATAHGETARGFGDTVEAAVDADGRFTIEVPEGVRHTFRIFVEPDGTTADVDFNVTAEVDAIAAAGHIALVLSRRR